MTAPSAPPELSHRASAWPAFLLLNLVVVPHALQGLHAGDTDLFYHLAHGRYMVEHGGFAEREVFSFTVPGRPWTNYHWLFQWSIYRLYALGGYGALVGFRAAVVIATANLLGYTVWRRTGGSTLPTVAVGLGTVVLYMLRALNLRSYLLSYLFLALTLVLLERLWRRPGSFEPWLPLVSILWANVHGIEYPFPLAAIAIYGVAAASPHLTRDLGQVVRRWEVTRWAVLFALSALAFALNPFGPRLLATPLLGLDEDAARAIAEMRPYDWRAIFTLLPDGRFDSLFLVNCAVLTSLALLPHWIARADVRPILFAALGTTLALRNRRFLGEYAILVGPFLAEAIARIRARRPSWSLDIALLALAAYITATAAASLAFRAQHGYFATLSTSAYPVGPARLLQTWGVTGHLFGQTSFGGYIEWMLHPRVLVDTDMRIPEPFDHQVYWRLRTADTVGRLQKLEETWRIDFVLLERDAPLTAELRRTPGAGFRLAWADQRFVLFAHERTLTGTGAPRTLEALDPADRGLAYVRFLPDDAARDALWAETGRLLDVWPENALAHETRLALLLARQPAEADRQAQRLMARFPRHARYPYYAGLARRALDDPRGALALFEQALDLDPEHAPLYPALADAALAAGAHRRGLEVLQAYFRRKDGWPTTAELLLLGNLRHRAHDRRGAADAYERALWTTRDQGVLRAEIENNLANAYVDLGEPDRALPLLEAALARTRPFPAAEFNRARAWARLGRVEAAREAFRRLADDEATPPDIRSRALAQLRQPAGTRETP